MSEQRQGSEVPRVIEDRSRSPNVLRYERKKKLGQGGFAQVFEVEHVTSHQIYACKVVQKRTLRPEHRRKLKNEIYLHRTLNNKHIVRFESYFEDSERVYILLEHCSHQSLMELLKRRSRLNEMETKYFMGQILEAVDYLHQMNIIHRDLKLGNLLLDSNMQIKICDFGLAAKLANSDERKTTICGTPNYIAPEILEGPRRGGHSFAVDIWSIGVILFTLLVGKPPFETKHVQQTYRRIKQLRYTFPPELRISTDAKRLISSILVINQERRPTLEQIKSDSFFVSEIIPDELPRWILYTPYDPSFTAEDYQREYQRYKSRRKHDDSRRHRAATGSNGGIGHGRERAQSAASVPRSTTSGHGLIRAHSDQRLRRHRDICTEQAEIPRSRSRSSSSQERSKVPSHQPPTDQQEKNTLHTFRNEIIYKEVPVAPPTAPPLVMTNPHGIMFQADHRALDVQVPERLRADQVRPERECHDSYKTSNRVNTRPAVSQHNSMTLESHQMVRRLNSGSNPKLPMKSRPRTAGSGRNAVRNRASSEPTHELRPSNNTDFDRRDDPESKQRSFEHHDGSMHADDVAQLNSRSGSLNTIREGVEVGESRSFGRSSSDSIENLARPHSVPHTEDEYHRLRSIHDEIERSFCEPPPSKAENLSEDMARLTLREQDPNIPRSIPQRRTQEDFSSVQKKAQSIEFEVFVKHWVDYSKKYGVGYVLSNGHIGVYFNDSTKIVVHSDQETVSYIDGQRDLQRFLISRTEDYSKEIQKKIQLLRHFEAYLKSNFSEALPHTDVIDLVYVKKWIKTRHAILFRLSNKIIQINFNDGTEIMLSSTTRLVTYTDKHKIRQTYPLEEILETTRKDLRKRMKYTQEILRRLVYGKR